jgi:hypothetical protein
MTCGEFLTLFGACSVAGWVVGVLMTFRAAVDAAIDYEGE